MRKSFEADITSSIQCHPRLDHRSSSQTRKIKWRTVWNRRWNAWNPHLINLKTVPGSSEHSPRATVTRARFATNHKSTKPKLPSDDNNTTLIISNSRTMLQLWRLIIWLALIGIWNLSCPAMAQTNETNTTKGDSSSLTGYESENLLALRWKIYEPVVTYDGLQFDLVFNVSDYIIQNYVGYIIYDTHECSDGLDNVITDEAYFDGDITVNGTEQEDGWGTREVMLATLISPDDIRNSNAYIPDGNDAHIDFCVRFGLFNNDPSDPESVEINFVEQKITLYVDLTDGFSVSDTIVEAKAVTQKTDSDAFFVIAFLCTSTGNEITDPETLQQGEVVRVCVEPTLQAYVTGLRMRRIDWFTWTRDDIPVSQEAIVGSAGALNGLTDLSCELGAVQCSFETLLNSLFFESPGITDGLGSATMQFGAGSGSRRLQRGWDSYWDRDLQSASPREIGIAAFDLEPVEDGLMYLPSRASRRTVLISALLVLGAFFVL